MTSSPIEILPKKWFRIAIYICAPLIVAIGIFDIWMTWMDTSIPTAVLVPFLILAVIVIVAGIISFPYINSKRIILDAYRVRQTGLFSREIPYEEIKKITVTNGRVEIAGEDFWKRISIGNLYTNFDSAIKQLAMNIEDVQGITIKGNKKYMAEYGMAEDSPS